MNRFSLLSSELPRSVGQGGPEGWPCPRLLPLELQRLAAMEGWPCPRLGGWGMALELSGLSSQLSDCVLL